MLGVLHAMQFRLQFRRATCAPQDIDDEPSPRASHPADNHWRGKVCGKLLPGTFLCCPLVDQLIIQALVAEYRQTLKAQH